MKPLLRFAIVLTIASIALVALSSISTPQDRLKRTLWSHNGSVMYLVAAGTAASSIIKNRVPE